MKIRGLSLELGLAPEVVSLRGADFCSHGLISGATGSGKTSTAKAIVEWLSASGIPVLAIDAKGDFAGISQAKSTSDPIRQATGKGANPPPPVIFLDPEGQAGHRIRLGEFGTRCGGREATKLLSTNRAGVGYVSLVQAAALLRTPRLYAEFVFELLNLLAKLPSVSEGEIREPQCVLVIEEAHFVFDRLVDGSRQGVPEILDHLKASGIGVVFIAPDPGLVPNSIYVLLQTRIQHALWSLSAETTRRLGGGSPEGACASVGEVVRALGIGEALVSLLSDGDWRRTFVTAPNTRDGPITDGERRSIIAATSWVSELSPRVDDALRSDRGVRISGARRKLGPHVRPRTRGPNSR